MWGGGGGVSQPHLYVWEPSWNLLAPGRSCLRSHYKGTLGRLNSFQLRMFPQGGQLITFPHVQREGEAQARPYLVGTQPVAKRELHESETERK